MSPSYASPTSSPLPIVPVSTASTVPAVFPPPVRRPPRLPSALFFSSPSGRRLPRRLPVGFGLSRSSLLRLASRLHLVGRLSTTWLVWGLGCFGCLAAASAVPLLWPARRCSLQTAHPDKTQAVGHLSATQCMQRTRRRRQGKKSENEMLIVDH
jgi:hypothetical protein